MRISTLALRRTSIAAIVLLLAMSALWWALWTLAAAQYRGVIDNWISSGRSTGYHIQYDRSEMFGFPHHVVLRLVNLRWMDTDGISFRADQMDLSSTPWKWQTFDASFKGNVELAAPLDVDGRTLKLAGDQGRAHVDLNEDGIWEFSRVSLTHAAFGRAPDVLFLADRLQASAQRPAHPPKDHTEPGLTLEGEAENVTLPQNIVTPFGPKMAVLETSLRVMGEVPDFRKKDSVTVWNTTGGVVEFEKLHMDWGTLSITAKGAIGFDDDLQPEGAFSGAVNHHEAVLKALMDYNFIAKRQASMLNSALSLFGKPSGSHADIEVPITIQLGGLFLGPVRIFVFPEIDWPKSEPIIPAPSTPVVPAPVSVVPAAPAESAQPESGPTKN